MLNGIHERGMNKDENIKVKIRKYLGASPIDILDHIKRSLGKAPEQIIIHAGTNDMSNSINYLKNVKKIVKVLKETCKDTKLSFSPVICRTDIKDISDTANTANSHLENYCKQQNVGFIDNENIKKYGLDPKRLHREAVFWRCSVKKVSLEISQNSQENTCARDSFLIKFQL